jgi:hypothetical protein
MDQVSTKKEAIDERESSTCLLSYIRIAFERIRAGNPKRQVHWYLSQNNLVLGLIAFVVRIPTDVVQLLPTRATSTYIQKLVDILEAMKPETLSADVDLFFCMAQVLLNAEPTLVQERGLSLLLVS